MEDETQYRHSYRSPSARVVQAGVPLLSRLSTTIYQRQ